MSPTAVSLTASQPPQEAEEAGALNAYILGPVKDQCTHESYVIYGWT